MEALLVIIGFLFMLASPLALVFSILSLKRTARLQHALHELAAAGRDRNAAEPVRPVDRSAATATAVARPAPAVVDVPAPSPAPEPAPTPAPRPAPAFTPPPGARNIKPKPPRDIESILGGQWLTWVGILALFFGTAFFLGVNLGGSGLSGWPQILIGFVVAAVFNLAGRYFGKRKERILGLGLLGGGVALAYLAAFAAHGFHGLVPLWVVFPALLIIAILGALLALKQNSLTIASLTLVGAFLTPIILRQSGDPTFALLPYLVAVNLGAMIVGLRRGWAGLPLGAFLATLILVVDWWNGWFDPGNRVFASLNITGVWLIYTIAPWLRTPNHRFWGLARAAVLSANGLFFGLFTYHLLGGDGESLRGAALALLAVVYLVISRLMTRREGEDEATRMTHLTGVALAVVAIPVQLDQAWVTVAWMALAGVLLQAGLRERDRWHRYSGLGVLVIVLLRSVTMDSPIGEAASAGYRPVLNGEFLAGLAVAGLLGWLFWAYNRYTDRLTATELKLRSPILIIGVVVLAWKLSTEILAWYGWHTANEFGDIELPALLWMSGFWSVYGLAATAIGLRTRYRPLRLTGYVIQGCSLVFVAVLTMVNGVELVETYRPVFNLPFMQGVVLSLTLGLLFWLMTRRQDTLSVFERSFRTPALITAICVLFVKVSLEVAAYFTFKGDAVAGDLHLKTLLTLSLVWAIYAGIVIVTGFATRFKPLRILGIALLGLTVVKVFVMDIQALDQGYRIAAFIGLGVLLLAVSVLYQRQRQIENRRGDEEEIR